MTKEEQVTKVRHDLKSSIAAISTILPTLKKNLSNGELSISIIDRIEERCSLLIKKVEKIFPIKEEN